MEHGMKDDSFLMNKATEAGEDYKYVFGLFPLVIGIAHDRWKDLFHDSVVFVEQDEETPIDMDNLLRPSTYTRHVAKFVPLVGGNPSQVYVPFLNSWMSEEEIKARALMKRAQCTERYERYGNE